MIVADAIIAIDNTIPLLPNMKLLKKAEKY